MTNLLNISAHEWDTARQFFNQYPDQIKLPRPAKWGNNNLPPYVGHSFIKMNNEIYAMANANYLGSGAFSKVKIVQNQQGENFKVCIRPFDENNDKTEEQILEKLHQYKGKETRYLPSARIFWKKAQYDKNISPNLAQLTGQKVYKISGLVEGDELTQFIFGINNTQKTIIAIKSCEALERLHENRIIHGDVKSQNILVKIVNNKTEVNFIDFGLSHLLTPGQHGLTTPHLFGTWGYQAPEITKPRNGYRFYSPASDIWALGATFQKLNLPYRLTKFMLEADPSKRMTLAQMRDVLFEHLKNCPPTHESRQLIKEYDLAKLNELETMNRQAAEYLEEYKHSYPVAPKVEHHRQAAAVHSRELENQRLIEKEIERRRQEAIRLEELENQRLAESKIERRQQEAIRLEQLENQRLAELEIERRQLDAIRLEIKEDERFAKKLARL